jgi:MFS family permease
MSAVTDYHRGFFNGIIAYGVSFIKSHLEPWRVLFLIEGLVTILFGVLALTILPESIEKARWLTGEEKDYREFQFDICAHPNLSALAKELRVFG